jgi:hypothetical protein
MVRTNRHGLGRRKLVLDCLEWIEMAEVDFRPSLKYWKRAEVNADFKLTGTDCND